MLTSFWFWITWLLADQFVPTNELDLIKMAGNYAGNGKIYRYFLDFEPKYGRGTAGKFWASVFLWVKLFEKDNNGNWSFAKADKNFSYMVDYKECCYFKGDTLAQKIFVLEDKKIRFSPDLEETTKNNIINYVKSSYNVPVVL